MRRWLVLGLLTLVTLAAAATALARTEVTSVESTMTGVIKAPDFTTGSGAFDGFTATDGTERVIIPGGFYKDTASAHGETVHVTRTLQIAKTDTLVIKFVAMLTDDGVEGTWTVLEGTGPYARLKGQGTFTAQVLDVDEVGLHVREVLVGRLTHRP